MFLFKAFLLFLISTQPIGLQAQYNQPNISFTTNGGCVGNATIFTPSVSGLVYNAQTQDSITLVIWDFGDGVIDTIDFLPDTLVVPENTHTYSNSGIFYPSLTVANRDLFDTTFTLRIVISPSITPTTTAPYFEDFDSYMNGWMQEENTFNTDTLWKWGLATGMSINTSMSGNNVWSTSTNQQSNENAWVYSPCFDLTNLDKPMIELSIWRDVMENVNGAVLQYYDDINQEWVVLGEQNRGINWYQDGLIPSFPGNQTGGNPIGWTGTNSGWENARYRLDNIGQDLRNRTDVRFRIAFSTMTSLGTYDGFAFDSVRIGNRTQNVLIEHFSGVGYPYIEVIEDSLYKIINSNQYNSEVNLIQYHTNFYTNDAIYQFNPTDVEARKYFYAITDANQLRINGLDRSINTSDLSALTGRENIDIALLKDSKFDILLSSCSIGSTINFSAKIKAVDFLPTSDYHVYFALVEDSVYSSNTHRALSVMRKILFEPIYNHVWNVGDSVVISSSIPYNATSFSYNWTNTPSFQNLKCIVFIQNAISKDVYCVESFLPEIASSYFIDGIVVKDSILNCNVDSLENGLDGIIIQATNNTDTYYASTDSYGAYQLFLDTGTYNLTILPFSPYSTSCLQNQVVTLDSNKIVNWVVHDTIECPLLEVDITAPFLRMTGGGSYYTVSYCNHGTATANNAYVNVVIDQYLNVLGSSIPITNQSGQIYTFNLGNIAIGQCGDFTINVIVDTSALAGQTHCTEAYIYPDSICTPNGWTGAFINTDGYCSGDSIYFTIQNIGSAMSGIRQYYVVEDNIMMRTDTFILGNGQSTTVIVNAQPGKTYRILAEQESGFPEALGNTFATASIEGCVTLPNGNFNTGFVTQFYTNNSSPFIAIDCQQNVSSLDPNDKAAQPEGYDITNHYIYQHTDLDYKIRFQNTGTDTAFLVVIRDTISEHLDLATLEMGASSHPYTWRLYGQGILEVTFSNILLPDSNVNEAASHGFFKYSIQQKANNPIGTVIYNSAAIYFDFNPPVITNTTWHTVGENFILTVSIDKIFDEAILAKVYPNPFTHATTMEIQGKTYDELTLTVFDLTGREIARKNAYYTNQLILQRGNLQPGIYVYKLEGDGKMIHAGKIVVQE